MNTTAVKMTLGDAHALLAANADLFGFIVGIVGALGGVAAVYVTYLTNKAARVTHQSKEKIDLLALGQTAMKDALARADTELVQLTDRANRCEIRADASDARAAASEARERECLERVAALQARVDHLEKEIRDRA